MNKIFLTFSLLLWMIITGSAVVCQSTCSVTISVSANPVRTGEAVTFTAAGLSALPPGSLKWFVNGVCRSGGNIDSGMVAFYPFNGNANDSSGNGNHAAEVTASLTTDRFGNPDAAYNFGGVTNQQYIKIPNSPSLQFTDQATFSLWVKMNSYYGLHGWGYWTDLGYHILFAKDELGCCLSQGIQGLANGEFVADISSNGVNSGIQFSDTVSGSAIGQWMNLTWVYTATQARMYVDGQIRKTTDGVTSFTNANLKELYFGRQNQQREFWLNGQLDDIRFYNRSLSDEEIRRIADSFDSLFRYTPQNNDIVYCVYQPFGSTTADTSNAIVMAVLPVPVYVIFITPDGGGLMNGSSWDNAIAGNSPAGNGYTKLADTLRHANVGAHLWIKEGSYLPCTDNDRAKSFQVPEGVSVYGGFAGNETSEEERNRNDHPSVLSGNIGATGSTTDNTFHVVATIGNASDQYIRIDGLTIRDGNTVNAPYPYGGGILTGYKNRIYNCLITSNNCEQGGGGVFTTGIAEIVGCTFSDNHAATGGAIVVSLYSTVTVRNCMISQNSAWSYGGGIENDGTCIINNSLIVNNSGDGGGIATWWMGASYTVTNSTIANNSPENILLGFSAVGTIKNSVISGGAIVLWPGASLDCQYSCTDDSIPGEGNIRQNPMFVLPTLVNGTGGNGLEADWHLRWCSPCLNTGNNALIPNGITTDLDGNPRILYSTVDPGAYETDTSGAAQNGIGFNNGRIYISSNRQYTGSGSTWETALAGNGESCKYQGQSLLFEAMKDAQSGTEIWVEKGTYKTSLYPDRNHSFTVGEGVKVYGGFLGNETLLTQRDPAINKTIFGGNIGDTATDADNAYHILNINPANSIYADSSLIDGITLEKARTEGNDAAVVIIHSGSKIRISGISVAGDTLLNSGVGFIIKPGARVALTDGVVERFSGGGIYNEGKLRLNNLMVKSNHSTGVQNSDSLEMFNCDIDSNSKMGGIWNKPGAVMNINGCNISGNKCNTYGHAHGGGIFNEGLLDVGHCAVSYNTAAAYGGGIFNAEGAMCTIWGSTISNNETTSQGGGLYNPTSVRNSIIVNNKGGTGYGLTGGGIFLSSGCEGIFSSTIMNNTGDGIGSTLPDTFEIRNSVIFGNDVSLTGHFNTSYSCIAGAASANHNITRNPYCINPSGGKGPGFNGLTANWSMWGCSPCVNAGSNAFLQSGDSLDAAGEPRVKWNTVDMGAMELQTDSVSGDCPPGISHNIVWEIFRPKVDKVQSTTGDPDQSVYLPALETELSEDLNTQSRLRGYLIPPLPGYYRFYFSADPFASFYLSTDSSDMNIRQISGTDIYGNYLWPQYPSIPDSIYMEPGKAYYFEAFCVGFGNCCYPWIKTPIKGNYLKIGWVLPGSASLTVIPWQNVRPAGPRTIHGVQWELFENQSTYNFDDLKNTSAVPDEVVRLDSLKTKDYSTTKDHFSSRIRGYLIAPVTGEYTFYFACDNAGQFWLSNDTLPDNAQLKSAINYCQPDWYQNASVQTLVTGERYYFEILHYDTVYTDLIKLGWKLPGDTVLQVIRYPFILNYNGSATLESFALADHEVTAFPGMNVTIRYHLAPWNVRNKSIRWRSGNESVATVNADGIISMVSPGVCCIVARPMGNPALSDSLIVTVTDYYGPWFVRQNASEEGDGHSWENAIPLTKLIQILNQGEVNQQVKIYVSEGTYKPTTTIDRNKTFLLNNLRIVGGFGNNSTGTDTTSRDFLNHETILSGEIGVPGETLDNSYHVIITQGSTSIDGFTIRDGRASCSSYGDNPFISYYKQDDNGGGIYAGGPTTIVTNCKITNNSAWNGGGGLHCRGDIFMHKNLSINNCEVYGNKAQSTVIWGGWIWEIIMNTYGAGIATSSFVSVDMINCLFHDNIAMGIAGAVYMTGTGANIERCSFYNNSETTIYASSGTSISLKNSTVKGSVGICMGTGDIISTTVFGSMMNGCNPYCNGIINLDNSFATSIDTSVFNAASTTIRRCIIGSNLYGDNKYTLLSNAIQLGSAWLDTLAYYGGPTPTMRLKNIPANPAKTHGNPAYLGTADQRGYTRTDTVSIGAYQWVWPSQITINPQQASMAPGDTLPYSVTVSPAWADDPTWSVASSDSQIIGIAANTMLAQSEGNALLMVRTNDGNRRDTCFVMVMTDSVGVNGIVHNGNANCYSALDVITVAGSGTSFVMQPGSNSEMIAGEKIFYLPGTTVKTGGSMHGYIAPQGPWCNNYKSSEDSGQLTEIDPQGTAISTGMEFVKVWPNPTTGMLYLAINTRDLITPVQATIFSFLGEVVFQDSYMGKTTTSISLESLPPGMYLLQLVQGDKRESVKLIKQ